MQTNEASAEHLSIIRDVEAGNRIVDGLYYKALEETQDIVRFSPQLIAISKIARIIYREHYHVEAVKITGIILTLNRELVTQYGKDGQGNDELWKEDLSIAAILSMCHYFPRFNENYLRENLSESDLFSKDEVRRIIKLIFAPGWNKIIIKRKINNLSGWKTRVLEFLKNIVTAPTPAILVFCTYELKALRLINQELKDKGGEAWSIVNLPKDEQLWYFSRIYDIVKNSPDKHVAKLMNEYRTVSMEIFKWLEQEKAAAAS
jgi:hypothetical protein